MDVRVGLLRKLSTEELMLLNCGVGEDSQEFLGLQGDPTSPSRWKSVLNIHWKDGCWIFSHEYSLEGLMLKLKLQYFGHWPPDAKDWLLWKDPDAGKDWRWERKWTTEDEITRMASPTWWTWVWASSGSWWWTGKPGVLWSSGLQRVGHDWATELNWTSEVAVRFSFFLYLYVHNLPQLPCTQLALVPHGFSDIYPGANITAEGPMSQPV